MTKARLYLGVENPRQEEDASTAGGMDIESVIVLFIYEYLGRPEQIELSTIEEKGGRVFQSITLEKKASNTFSNLSEASSESQLARLPVIVLEASDAITTVISGLCSVCRTIVQLSGREEILGFKKGCLAAPSEASVWTKFCEIDALRFIERLMEKPNQDGDKLDVEFARFEMHLKQPVRIHNFAKVIQDMRIADSEDKLEKDSNDSLVIRHQFVEGPSMFLADLILFSVFYFAFRRMPTENLKDVMPLTTRWFELMEKVTKGGDILDKITRKMVRT